MRAENFITCYFSSGRFTQLEIGSFLYGHEFATRPMSEQELAVVLRLLPQYSVPPLPERRT